MAVMVATSLGDMVVDLYTDQCPVTTKNFLKLCKIKYYNHCLFHSVQKDFIVQTGDPSGIGSGGESIYSFLYGEQARFFDDEIKPKLKHDKIGVLAMASAGENLNASQFYITTRAGIDYLDGKHTVFGEVAEGLETLMRINEAFVDEKNRPYKNIRIKHMYILDDPFDDPPGLAELIPDMSPELKPPGPGQDVRLEDDWVPLDEQLDPAELEQSLRKKEAHSRAVVLEMIGDIPEAEMKPPENVLFVCKLNPVTQDEDLEIIFSRFGKVISADIIRDYKTGDSLCYGFIEFESQEACEAAYFKMDNTLIDDRRIHVDFSQSVARLWTRFRRFGIKDSSEAANPSSKGCFKCGEPGHFAKDCTNTGKGGETEGPPETKRYELKEEDGQRGNLGKRYEMLFPDEGPKREYHGRDAGKSQERGEDAPSPASRMEKKHERHHDGMQRESPRDAHDRDHGRGRHRDHERVHHRDGPRPPRHREDFQKGRGSDDRRERYYGDRKRRETEDEEPREGGHRGDVDRRHRRSDRERERREEARRDQEDREKEAAESESRDRKRRERDTGSREEDKHRQDRHYKDVDRSRRPHEQRRDRN